MISVPNLDKRIITFIGPEGSGKSTLARKLAEDAQKPFISTGDLIRELAKNDPGPLGEECREMFRNHTYLSPVTLLQILKNRYIQNDMAHGFVVDKDPGVDFPEHTVSYSRLRWVRVEDFARLADQKDPQVIERYFGDPFDICVTGLCVTAANETSQQLLKVQF